MKRNTCSTFLLSQHISTRPPPPCAPASLAFFLSLIQQAPPHTVRTQESDDRLVKLAYEFNLNFAAGFQASVAAADGAGSDGVAAADAGGSSAGYAQAAGNGDGGNEEAGEGGGNAGGNGGGDSVGESLVDNEWKRLPGGPFTAKLMTRSRQPVAHANYRNYAVTVPIDPVDGPLYPGCEIKFPIVAGGPTEGIICNLPQSWGAEMHMLILKLKLSKNGATEDTVTIASALYREPRRAPAEHDDHGEGEEAAAVGPMAAEPPLHSSPIAPTEVAEEEDVDTSIMDAEPVEAEEGGDEADEGVAEAAGGAMEEGDDDHGGDADEDGIPQWILDHGGDANSPAAADSDGEGGDGAAEGQPPSPPPPPPPPPSPPVVPRSSSRQPKRKERFGDNGEFEGAASRFRSAPPSRKASIDPSVEMGVPAYALPGNQVWAIGLHAGTRKRFKAEVVGLRNQFPRIIVKYIATEDDVKAAIALPEMKTAYLHMGDVKKRDW